MGAKEQPGSAGFQVGQRVIVKSLEPTGHNRTPAYMRGKQGEVVKIQGSYKNPESLAYGGDGLPLVPVYTVMFDWAEVWGHTSKATSDKILADIFEHWLDPA